MFGCAYEDLKEYPFFNTPYKIHMRGFVGLEIDNFIYLLYSHGKTIGMQPNQKTKKAIFYEEEELKAILINKEFDGFDYEEELIIDQDEPLFASNLFSVKETGPLPWREKFLFVNSEIETLQRNITREIFLEKMLGIKPTKSTQKRTTLDDFFKGINDKIYEREKQIYKDNILINNIENIKIEENIKENIKYLDNIYKKDDDINWR